jgi:hypothetical protein
VTKGFYGGGTFGWPTPFGAVGGGLYFDNHGDIYPQIYYGTPKFGFSAGYSPDLESFLTGTSVGGNFGGGRVRYNIGASGGSTGIGVGTPGFGATYGFGPYRLFPASAGRSNGEDSFGDRFGNWASTPIDSVAQAAENRPDLFNQRFGNWGSAPTSNSYSPASPVLRELLKYKAAAPDNPVLSPDETSSARPTFRLDAMPLPTSDSIGDGLEDSFNGRFGNWPSSSVGTVPPGASQQGPTQGTTRLPGLVTGRPMPNYPVPIWDLFDPSPASGDGAEDWFSRWIGPRS